MAWDIRRFALQNIWVGFCRGIFVLGAQQQLDNGVYRGLLPPFHKQSTL